MAYDVLGAKALNYAPCKYGNSRILFRGPQRRLDVPYVACVGGTETYGKFIKTPFAALVENDIGLNCINFGVANAGVDVFLHDTFLLEAASGARVTVLQVVGAQNMSNRFYSVHPRRNDRFLTASEILKSIYPEVDFSEFHFTRHMLNTLFAVSPDRFDIVRVELQKAWSSRMQLLLRRTHGQVVLLWFADHAPLDDQNMTLDPSSMSDPMFITRSMMDELCTHVVSCVEVTASQAAQQAGTDGMIFDEMEASAAEQMLGPKAHGEVAAQLGMELLRLV